MTVGLGVNDEVRRQRAFTGDFTFDIFRGSVYQYAHGSGKVKYVCRNMIVGASTSATDWLVWKYSDAALPQSEGPRAAPNGIAAEATLDLIPWSF
jgi:hypothetical protein